MSSRSLLYPPNPNPDPNNHSRSLILIAAACSALVIVFFLLLFLYLYLSLRLRRRSPTIPFPDLPSSSSSLLRRFPRRDLRLASAGFDPSRLLGRGASASVYLGIFPSGKSVAIKTLDPSTATTTSSDIEFRNELLTLSSLAPSPFVLSLLGFCFSDDDRMLVYEYMPNGSLQKALFASSDSDSDSEQQQQQLNWDRRFQIILDVARGLEFLHLECHPPVIHGDVKPSNVLLGPDFRAKIADFGLAKFKLLNEVDPGADGFSQDLGLMSPHIDLGFDRTVWASSSSPPSKRSDFEGRVRCNPIARVDKMKGKDAAATPLDDEVYVSVEHSKELNDGDWWWKQEGSGELNSRDYVREWIGSQICSLGNPDCENEDNKCKKSERKEERKSGSMKEWWKEEYFEEMNKKNKCNKGLNWFNKCSGSSSSNNTNNNNNIDASFRKGSWRMKKRRSMSVGSELFSGDLFSRELSSTATSMRGTLCYVAPEHGNCGQFMEKSDIYSFGVLILVTVSGRRPLHVLSSPVKLERANLISWCRQLASSGNVLDLVDERLKDCYNNEQASLCINLALLCLQKSPELRPDSGEIVRILKGEMEIPDVPFEFSPSPNSKMYSKSRRKTSCDPE